MQEKSKGWIPPTDNMELKSIIRNVCDVFTNEDNILELITSIRTDTMYVELIWNGDNINQQSEFLPDYIDDVEIENRLLKNMLFDLLSISVNTLIKYGKDKS